MKLLDGVTAEAAFSECGTYRYTLTRRWGTGRTALWIMLNPSTASHEVDDPTVRRTQTFSRSWGFEQVTVCNLFALRSTDPQLLYKHPSPIGPGNDRHIRAEAEAADLVVAAWGVHGALNSRGIVVLDKVLEGLTVHCLGTTGFGYPCHPLYLKADKQLEVYR